MTTTSDGPETDDGATEEARLQQAADELYGGSPEEFMARRTALVAAAKQSGAKKLAKDIAALRKPSKSAAALNKLARQDPDGIAELLDLGERLRQAERSVDPKQIRELTRERRTVLNTLMRRAFEITDETSPSAAMKEEVTSTLTAALVDSAVADQLAGGTLLTSASWEGFGFGGPPELTVVREPRQTPASAAKPAAARGGKIDREQAKNAAAAAEADRKAQAAEAAAEARRVALDDARQAVDDAEEAVVLAADEEQIRMERLRELEEQVADARRAVDEARIQLRRAELRRRRVGEALDRLER